MTTTDHWQKMFSNWAGQDPLIASTGERSNPGEMAAVGVTLADWMDLDQSQAVLDVGCASGTLTNMWAHRARSVIGVDYSEALLADARTHHGDSGMEFVHADAADLPFADDSFDAVCTYAMLLCLPDHDHARRAIDEILRVAAPGASIVLGGLPDTRCKEIFFDHCDAMTAWFRRAIPRRWRWAAKRVLRPHSRPGETVILWFDIEELVADLREAGYAVQVEPDPELSNYASYRKSLILTRAGAARI